jgi:uncharacterized cofD-like protein
VADPPRRDPAESGPPVRPSSHAIVGTRRPGAGGRTRPAQTAVHAVRQERSRGADVGPSVVALGGGHGLAAALQAIRRYAPDVTAVVSVADDGGSSGRLRRALDVPAPGDIRKCLVALSDDPVWAAAFEHRFAGGELEGHALGNLLIVGLAEALGDFAQALEEAGRVLRAVGRVLPATVDPVALKADVEDRVVEGQVAVMNARGRIRRVSIVPADAAAHPEAVVALRRADQIVLAPGSLYTSLMSVVCVPEIAAALAAARGRVVQVLNLRQQTPETSGLDGTDHLRATLDHGARVDVVVHHDGPVADGWLAVDPTVARALGVEVRAAPVARADGLAHEPARLASLLAQLV